ncbi:hypothetical protein ACG94V_21505 [Acinetobacter sp. ULE_I001]|uniref:hypothetical protein n=1 Tax=Acinetobacter sp. ULE_I001 TaxID=3373064 RepID=UPI003AF4D6D1
MTTEAPKNYTFSIPEIQNVLGVDKDLDKSAIQEKLKGFKQYPKFIYSLDDLNTVYEFNVDTYERAQKYVDSRNVERVKKAQATRLANKAKIAKEEKKAKSKPANEFDELGKLYVEQAKLRVEIAKLSQEQNLLDKKIVELEKKMNVR